MDQQAANQAKLDRLMRDAQRRIPVGTVITNHHGTARWNGDAWVYGEQRFSRMRPLRFAR